MSPSWQYMTKQTWVFLDENRRRNSVRNPLVSQHCDPQQRLPKPLY